MEANNDLLEQAFKELNYKWNEKYTITDFEEDIVEVESDIIYRKEKIQDLNDDIETTKLKAAEKIKEIQERLSKIEDGLYENETYLNQRKSILRQIEVIHYRELNPDLDIN